MFRFWIINFLFFICMIVGIDSFENGAPNEACGTMTPHHVDRKNSTIILDAQTTTSPFVLLTSANGVASLPSAADSRSVGTPVPFLTVTLDSTFGNTTFEGFLVQAHSVINGSKVSVGSFRVANQNSSQAIDCFGGLGNAVTHTNNQKRLSETFRWFPDVNFSGQVVFRATVVAGYSRFWLGIESKPISVTPGPIQTRNPPSV